MSETDVVQRVDSAEMADLFSKSFLMDGEDFLSTTTELTFNDVRRLNLNSGEKGKERPRQRQYEPTRPTNWEALRGREPSSELDLRATRAEDSWLSGPQSPKKAPIRRSSSVEEYLRMKDASRPSFNKRSTSSCVEAASHVMPSAKGLDRLVRGNVRSADSAERHSNLDGYRRRAVSPAPGYSPSVGLYNEKPTAQFLERRQSAGSRRSKVSSPVLSGVASFEGVRRASSRASNDSMASYEGSYCATPASAVDPPCSPCSSRASAGGRESYSRLHNALSCNVRMGGNTRRADSPRTHTAVERLSRRGSTSNTFGWSAAQGCDTDLLSPKSCASDGGRTSFGHAFSQRDLHFSDGEEGLTKQTAKHRLFSSGLQKAGKSKLVPEAQKGTRLKAKQEPRISRPWKGT